jgi:hypothetical protein
MERSECRECNKYDCDGCPVKQEAIDSDYYDTDDWGYDGDYK